jgi:hypothetical protein
MKMTMRPYFRWLLFGVFAIVVVALVGRGYVMIKYPSDIPACRDCQVHVDHRADDLEIRRP